LELKAAILALKAFLRIGMQPPLQSLGHHPQHHILLEIDNTNAVAYVNRRGDSVTIYVPTDLGTVVLPAEFYPPTSFATTSNFQKVRGDKATALLVAPDWPGQP